jgi:predicted ATPase
MPLALELAASWLRLLSVTEIAVQLEAGIDLLEAPIRDVPARHKSVRATFELSWKLLLPREQEALRRLCVFRGGFTLEAARAVADASLPLLLAFANKSFLRRNDPSAR